MIRLSDKVNNLEESQTIAMAQKSRALKAKGFDVINLSLGEPDFLTPIHIREAAKHAIDQGYSFYTPVAGYLDLREAICTKFERDNNLQYTPDQIVVSTGAKQSIINLLMCLINPGDEVIVPAPYWVSYIAMIELCGGKPVILNSDVDSNFKFSAAQLEKAINEKTKVFLFSSPCNPTGTVFNMADLASYADVLAKHPDIVIISDEIYEYIQFEEKHVSIAQFPGFKERTAVVNGLSKGYAMTGWRLGYLAAPKELADACTRIQGQFTSATCSITQRAAITALLGNQTPSKEFAVAFKQRKELVINMLKTIPGVICNNPDGAFYVFPEISYYFGKNYEQTKINSASDLAMYLLENAHVAVVTGEAFGNPECIRISFAQNEEILKTAINRIALALSKIK